MLHFSLACLASVLCNVISAFMGFVLIIYSDRYLIFDPLMFIVVGRVTPKVNLTFEL